MTVTDSAPSGGDSVTERQKQPMDPFPTAMTQAVAEVLAQTDYPGLTGRGAGAPASGREADGAPGRPEQA